VEIQWHLLEKDFFSGLPNEKNDFISLAIPRCFEKKESIFLEGSVGGSAFYLEEGKIRIFRVSSVGKEAIVFIRNRGEMFGLAEILGEQKRVFNAQAITSCRLFEIKRKDFEMLLRRHFSLAQRVIEVLGRRVRYLGEQLESLIVGDVPTRLLRLLTCLCWHGVPDAKILDKPILIPVKLTQEQIAAMIGSSQQTVSETLKKFKEEGLIDISGKEITILKPREIFDPMLA
jgi:CRP/FNR family transcriptional regulator, cyclic AMP receptor protein